MKKREIPVVQSISWEKIVESIPGIYYFFNSNGEFVAWNEEFERVTEYSYDEILQLNPLDLFEGIDREQVELGIKRVFETGSSFVEAKLVSKSGKATPYFFSGTKMLIEGVPHISGLGIDKSETKHIEDQLIYINQEYLMQASALNATKNAVFITNKDGVIQWVNKAFEEMTGFSRQEAKGKTPAIMKSGMQNEDYYSELWKIIRNGGHWHGEFINKKKNGDLYILEESITPVFNENKEITHFIAIKQDITERKNQENKIKRLNRIYNILSSINTLIVRSPQKKELYLEAVRISVEAGNFDLAIIDTYGHKTDEISFCTGYAKNPEELKKYQEEKLTHVISGDGLISRSIREQKPVFSNDITSEPPLNSNRRKVALAMGYRSMISLPLIVNQKVVAILSLLSKEVALFNEDELKLLNELSADISFSLNHLQTTLEAKFLSHFNPVTELPNRKNFLEKLSGRLLRLRDLMIDECFKRAIVIVFDVEKFRNLNSRLGRNKGDEVLRTIRDRFSGFPYKDYLFGHLERDHFSVYLEGDFSTSDLVHILKDIQSTIFENPFVLDGTEYHLTGRFGVSQYPGDTNSYDHLLKYAEDARDRANIARETYAFYSPELNAKVFKEQILENQLRKALARDEFEFYYQPKYNAFTGNINGCEALIRWNNPSGEYIGPDVFIPILEEIGLIHEIGIFAISNALKKYNHWKSQGFNPPRIAVNISPVQFSHPDFQSNVETLLNRQIQSGNSREIGIDLEITENSIMNHIEATISSIESFRKLGMKIAIDDFGTGYSSLNSIARLPFDSLKIDKSFVFSMEKNPSDMTIVATIITLAHQLGLSVVAEGVETENQAQLLRDLKCNEFQGYLYCKPLPEGEFLKVLRSQSCQ